MKRGWIIIIGAVLLVIGAKFGIEYIQGRAGTIEAIKANASYIQIVKAMDSYVEAHKTLPRSLADLKSQNASLDLEGFEYTPKENGRCIISFKGKHGYFGHPLDFGDNIRTNAVPP